LKTPALVLWAGVFFVFMKQPNS